MKMGSKRLLAIALVGAACCAFAMIGGASGSHAAGCIAEDPVISGGISTPCGVIQLENDAYDTYVAAHDLTPGDANIKKSGQLEIVGMFWASLQSIIDAEHDDNSAEKADIAPYQVEAYQWYQQDVVQPFQELAAQDALDEYNKWKQSPCTYDPPNTSIFNFAGQNDPACHANFSQLFRGLRAADLHGVPRIWRIQGWHRLRAERSARLATTAGRAIKDEVLRSSLSWLSALAIPAAEIPALIFRPELIKTVFLTKRATNLLKAKAQKASMDRAQEKVTDEIVEVRRHDRG